jgi:hypothetical protein
LSGFFGEQADHTVLLELIGFPLQRSLGSTRFSRPLRRILMEKELPDTDEAPLAMNAV